MDRDQQRHLMEELGKLAKAAGLQKMVDFAVWHTDDSCPCAGNDALTLDSCICAVVNVKIYESRAGAPVLELGTLSTGFKRLS